MDSMRNLNRSLPRSSPPSRRKQANSDLLQAFKTAALSVTQLYKTASAEEEAAREAHDAGYVEALDDILCFLDEQNLGLGDGEGWQVREWATQRHQSMYSTRNSEEGSAPLEEEDKRPRSTSPGIQLKLSPTSHYQSVSVQTDPEFTQNDESLLSADHSQETHARDIFHSRSPPALPSHQDVHMTSAAQASPPSLKLEVLPRHTRNTTHRSNHHGRVSDRMPPVSLGTLGHGAGSKRKIPLHEFFDLGSIGGGRESTGGGKRGKLT